MATYIVLGNYTDQGIRNIKQGPQRVDAARELAKKLEVEFKEFFLTIGQYDFVTTLEAPDDATAAKFALSAGSLGNVRTTTLKALTEAEFREVVQALP